MYSVPCGQNMGHGSSCTDGYLCDSCERIVELEAQVAKLNVTNQRWMEMYEGALRQQVEWQPIETAPKDKLIDIWYGKRLCDCYYDERCNEWRTSQPSGQLIMIPAKKVTHWMRLPEPPQKALEVSDE